MSVNLVRRVVVMATLCLSVHSQSTKPPSMVTMPDETIYFKDSETVIIPCKATAEPAPRYYWTRDGRAFDPIGNDDRWVIDQ